MEKRRITKAYYLYYLDRYKDMLHSLAVKHAFVTSDIDDNINISQRELLYCMIHYLQGYALTTFVYSRINGILRHQQRKMAKFPATGLNLVTDSVVEEDLETPLLIQELLSFLTTIERQVIELSFFQGKSLRQIGKQLGTSRVSVNNIKERALNQLKNVLETNCV